MADGGDLRISVHIVRGANQGPRLAVLAVQHGYEVFPISIIRNLVSSLDPKEMRGTLVMVPVGNPVAFAAGTRTSWVDSLYGDSGNMNRLWPRKPDGWLTERMTHALANGVIRGSDCVIDLHDGTLGQPWLKLYYGYYTVVDGELGKEIERIATAFGMEILMSRPAKPTTLAHFAVSEGIPVFSGEMGSFYGLEKDRQSVPARALYRTIPEVGVTGVTNVMKVLGMLPGEPRLPRSQVKVSPEINLRPSHGGLL